MLKSLRVLTKQSKTTFFFSLIKKIRLESAHLKYFSGTISQMNPLENVYKSKTIKTLLQNPKSFIKAFDSELHI